MTSVAICTSIDQHSAVAHSTVTFADAMTAFADVSIYAEPTTRPLACAASVRPLPPEDGDVSEIEAHDHVLLVVGNSLFHRNTVLHARRLQGTVIIHDHVLAHVMVSIFGHPGVEEMLELFAPRDLLQGAIASLESSEPFYRSAQAERIPLVEPVLRCATGVVVHSDYSRSVLAPRTPAPIATLRLPGFSEPPPRGDWDLETVLADAVVIATTGHVNENRQHEKVIAALPHLTQLGRPVHYVLAGQCTPTRRAELTALARGLGVGDRLHILGRVPAGSLGAVVHRADLLANLRSPAFEGASASTLEAMACGRPMVVCNGGWYAELPDDAVIKVPPSIDSVSLAAAIMRVLGDPERARAMSASARRFAESHTAERYASDLLQFLEASAGSASLVSTCFRIADITKAWEMSPHSPLARRTARTLLGMLGPADG